jgi:uncharacterized protein (TIGR03437 family)
MVNCLRSHRSAIILSISLLLAGAVSAQTLFNKPVKVLGDPNFIGTAANPLAFDSFGPNVVEGRELSQPFGIAVDNSSSPAIVYVADTANNRVLAYQYNTQLTAGAFADLILGQPDRFTNVAQGPGVGQYSTGLNSPTGLAVDSAGNLYVADTGNNRILRYPKPFSQPAGFQFPNMIIGQTSFSGNTANSGGVKASTLSLSTGRTGLAFDGGGNLWVTDSGNNRVLRFPAAVLTAGTNGPSADRAIGQADLVSSVAATAQNSLTALGGPTGVTFDPAGNMLVADQLHRVLVYPSGVTFSSSATMLLGIAVQPATPINNTGFGSALAVVATGSDIFVSDPGNNRVLVYPPVASLSTTPPQISPPAAAVIGQTSFTTGAANGGNPEPSSSTLNLPADMAVSSTELYVTDALNNRVLVFPLISNNSTFIASRVIGQLNFQYRAANLIEGKEFGFSGGTASASGSAILDYSATPPHLYVADTLNNRILGYNDFTHLKNGQAADIVIGQADLFRALVNFPTNDATMPNRQGLNGPSSLVVDSAGNLYVADTFNSRILRFPTPFNPPSGSTELESADLVLGQQDFASAVTDASPATMSAPISLAFTRNGANAAMATGMLFAVDASQNRVLAFSKPFTNGMAASLVLGQSSYTATAAASTSAGFAAPRGVAIDPQDRVLVADAGNRRVQVFDQAANLSPGASASFSLTTGFSQPVAIGMASGGDFWVADNGAQVNHLLHFPSVEVLPTVNYASDGSQPAVSPRAAFVDQYNNLLVADGINRVLYFAPQVAAVNAANYISGRALAPGTIAAVFPSISTNIIANGTQTNTVIPLPTVMADTEVLINGTAVPLFYVSPGQINFVLPIGLAANGTADLQIVRQSTGQIYGAAEIALASASPGLFTAAGTGTGQIAALNADNSLNSSSNPAVHGQVIQLFGTGQGFVANAPTDGMPSTGLVPTSATPLVLLNNEFVPSTNVQYSGLAPEEIGVWQINVLIPDSTAPGNSVPLQVFMSSIPSGNPNSPGQIATTIAVK